MNPMQTNAGAINPAMPQNDVNAKQFRNFNTFPMSYRHYLTARYGDITPFYVFDSWADDKVPFASFHELRNHTMSSPLMSSLKMNKDYFLVPYQAILPRNWEYFIANPNFGDDIPDDVAPIVNNPIAGFLTQLQYFVTNNYRNNVIDKMGISGYLATVLKYVISFENLVSDGSLFSLLGCKLSKYVYDSETGSIDSFFAGIYSVYKSAFENGYLDLYIGSNLYSLSTSPYTISTVQSPYSVSWSRLMELMRDNSDFTLRVYFDDDDIQNKFLGDISNNISRIMHKSPDTYNFPINLSRLIAYQICCFHFMTNDNVDSIYSANLYRDMMQTYYTNEGFRRFPTFEMNGVEHQYDVFSNRLLDWAFMPTTSTDYLSEELQDRVNYLYGLLSFRKSLKFGDYFTGSRTRPLAVGDVNAPVVNNGVSAIDITKNIAMQRFLNAVNKTGRKLSEYSKKLIGGYVQPVATDPKFLASDSVMIGQQEVENTSNIDTGSIVTNLRSEQSKYAFEAEVSEPSIIIGLMSFEMERSYCRTIDRHFFHKDRFDMFNSYFQNIGDQEVYGAEKGQLGKYTPFAYQLRHMEYKQRYSIASGGFVDNLPSWTFIADNNDGTELSVINLSSDYIRSSCTDFDRFYSALTGDTLSNYFHFIIKFDNQSTPLRNMEFNPTIL